MSSLADQARAQALASRATVAVITALTKEQAAMESMLDGPVGYSTPGKAPGEYLLGEIPSKDGRTHAVVLVCVGMGQNASASRVTLLLERFQLIESVIISGIAGAAPGPAKTEHDVRLGDLVISSGAGVIQYDFQKETRSGGLIRRAPRYPPRPPGARLLDAAQALERAELRGSYPWEPFFARASSLKWTRRPTDPDVLYATAEPLRIIERQRDPERRKRKPRAFYGPIASANRLLKNALIRDELRDTYGAKAVEMEAAGVAEAAWLHSTGYLVVRGTCDYCDEHKADAWQGHAAMIAAAYVRALLGEARSADPPRGPDLDSPNGSATATSSANAGPSQRAPGAAHAGVAGNVARMFEWLEQAKDGDGEVPFSSLRAEVGALLAPLLKNWKLWMDSPLACASHLDLWGRGGLARLAMVLARRPETVVTADARSSSDIKRAARTLLPLFDVLIIKWKGRLIPRVAQAPLPVDSSGYGSGGGYVWVCDGVAASRDGFATAATWANLLPEEVVMFLVRECAPLMRAGRLVIVPASLAGSTQSDIGWTDTMLLDTLLPGAVDCATGQAGARTLDLAEIKIPYINNVSLADLASVLDESEGPNADLREHLLRLIESGRLHANNWPGLARLGNEIEGAMNALEDRLRRAYRRGAAGSAKASLIVARRTAPGLGDDQVTEGLAAVARLASRELRPWIPYWRLSQVGGRLAWGKPLDNKSIPFASPGRPVAAGHSWLHPGDGGIWIRLTKESSGLFRSPTLRELEWLYHQGYLDDQGVIRKP